MSAIADVLWPGLRALAPGSQLGGILARKPGYHNSRDHLPADDYSVAQFGIDRKGPASEGSAIDWTFPEAQSGDYRRIAHFSRLLLEAGRNGDPRAYPMREFFGNADSDSEVEGWDYARNKAATSGPSHLWHIHKSIHRMYINDAAAMRSILAILAGAPVPSAPKPPAPVPAAGWPRELVGKLETLRIGAEGPAVGRLQALLNQVGARLSEDRDFGQATQDGLRRYQRAVGLVADGVAGRLTWARLLGVSV